VRRLAVALTLGLAVLAAGCGSPSQGTVKGVYEEVGGPPMHNHGLHYISGTVTLSGEPGSYRFKTNAAGRFEGSLAPGEYRVTGSFCNNPFPSSVIIRGGEVTHLTVGCSIR